MHHRRTLIRCLAIIPVLVLVACSSQAPSNEEPLAAVQERWPEPVGEVALTERTSVPESQRLDVALVLFEAADESAVAADRLGGRLEKVRRAESRYMPALLRDVMMRTMAWGAVRVMPEPQSSAELQVTGEILHSDGMLLVLHITAQDVTGRQWLDRVYTDRTEESDYPVTGNTDPFQNLYHAVANDLLAVRESLSPGELTEIRRVGLLRYAAALAPAAFDDYLKTGSDGLLHIARLPAENDPMLERIRGLREHEYLLIDTLDEEYRQLRGEMRSSYDLWRRYSREQLVYRQEYLERVAERDREGRSGSFTAMSQTYNAFRNSKIHEQDLRELAQGFSNEVSPTVLELQGRVYRLSGSLDDQYEEWRGILREIFRLETGLSG